MFIMSKCVMYNLRRKLSPVSLTSTAPARTLLKAWGRQASQSERSPPPPPTQACSLEVHRVLNLFKQLSQKGPEIWKGGTSEPCRVHGLHELRRDPLSNPFRIFTSHTKAYWRHATVGREIE